MGVPEVSEALRDTRGVLGAPAISWRVLERVSWGLSRTHPQDTPWNPLRDHLRTPWNHLGVPREGGACPGGGDFGIEGGAFEMERGC